MKVEYDFKTRTRLAYNAENPFGIKKVDETLQKGEIKEYKKGILIILALFLALIAMIIYVDGVGIAYPLLVIPVCSFLIAFGMYQIVPEPPENGTVQEKEDFIFDQILKMKITAATFHIIAGLAISSLGLKIMFGLFACMSLTKVVVLMYPKLFLSKNFNYFYDTLQIPIFIFSYLGVSEKKLDETTLKTTLFIIVGFVMIILFVSLIFGLRLVLEGLLYSERNPLTLQHSYSQLVLSPDFKQAIQDKIKLNPSQQDDLFPLLSEDPLLRQEAIKTFIENQDFDLKRYITFAFLAIVVSLIIIYYMTLG